MKWAIRDTVNDIVNGDNERRIHAIFTLVLWFGVATYLSLSIFHYIPMDADFACPIFGQCRCNNFNCGHKIFIG